MGAFKELLPSAELLAIGSTRTLLSSANSRRRKAKRRPRLPLLARRRRRADLTGILTRLRSTRSVHSLTLRKRKSRLTSTSSLLLVMESGTASLTNRPPNSSGQSVTRAQRTASWLVKRRTRAHLLCLKTAVRALASPLLSSLARSRVNRAKR